MEAAQLLPSRDSRTVPRASAHTTTKYRPSGTDLATRAVTVTRAARDGPSLRTARLASR
ncbi:hypothetical protein [Nocardioides sp. GY 10113]|uniref:hypothetical protein n=1 Tax=Nocardioides sp. GY 10113 TaxID=2569761 RepID=UPI001F0F7B50|nr:hypothetical protein [Nocardioides sp. GY 10113]